MVCFVSEDGKANHSSPIWECIPSSFMETSIYKAHHQFLSEHLHMLHPLWCLQFSLVVSASFVSERLSDPLLVGVWHVVDRPLYTTTNVGTTAVRKCDTQSCVQESFTSNMVWFINPSLWKHTRILSCLSLWKPFTWRPCWIWQVTRLLQVCNDSLLTMATPLSFGTTMVQSLSVPVVSLGNSMSF